MIATGIMFSRKGVVYTLSLTLLALVLLAVATLYVRQGHAAQERFAELGGRQRVYDLEKSVQAAFTEALMKEAGFRFSTNANSFTVNSRFPQNLTAMAVIFDMIENNTERDFPFIELNVSLFNQEQEFLFMPSLIHYVQKKPDEIAIGPGQDGDDGDTFSSIIGYGVSLTFSSNITSCVSNLKSGDKLKVAVSAVSPFGNCVIPNTTLNELTMDMASQGKNIRLEIKGGDHDDEGGTLTLKSEASIVSSIAVLVQPLPESGSIELPITMNVNESALSYVKSSRIVVS